MIKNFNFSIVENPPIQKILAYENIIRPHRYYSSDKNLMKIFISKIHLD